MCIRDSGYADEYDEEGNYIGDTGSGEYRENEEYAANSEYNENEDYIADGGYDTNEEYAGNQEYEGYDQDSKDQEDQDSHSGVLTEYETEEPPQTEEMLVLVGQNEKIALNDKTSRKKTKSKW